MSIDWAVEKRTARGRVLFTLRDLKWHSHVELTKVGGQRFSARLLELRRLGYKMESRAINGDKVLGNEYRLLSLEIGDAQAKKVKVYLNEVDAERILGGRVTRSAASAIKSAIRSFRANKHKL